MLIKKLTLTDIGTYAGSQDFDLVPKIRYGVKRPIVLFGGLNGAGKTTFLTAVRLALYGRQSLDFTPSQRQYEEYLRDLVHRPKQSLVRPAESAVVLEFEHSRFGQRETYSVVRYWSEKSRGIEEKLVIKQGEAEPTFLEGEQAQAFLNQLIPPGIAQFFFFDGEKIAALAKDDTDVVLADAIRRLLGLDLLDRLNSDLNVFLRSHRAQQGDQKVRKEINDLEILLKNLDDEYAALEGPRKELEDQRAAAKEQYHSKKADLSAQGGAWSVNRNALEYELDELRLKRRQQEDSLRELLNGVGIFALSKKLCARVVQKLHAETQQVDAQTVHSKVKGHAEELNSLLVSLLGVKKADQPQIEKVLTKWVEGFAPEASSEAPSFGLSTADARRAIELLESHRSREHAATKLTFESADGVLKREENIQDQLAHAPSDESIKVAVEQLTAAAEEVGRLDTRWKALIEEQRRVTWLSIDVVRKLRKLEEKLASEADVQRGHIAAEAMQDVIAEFKVAAAHHKCKQLRTHFLTAFKRLARKDDIIRDAVIDPESFKITLIDGAGREVPKKHLSAGEKQIYSIAMLEALAKTSGRNLPVIIDTPLGRLDSRHRTKLVESYFPVASHQVIILSTDTEVDTTFYKSLAPSISHAYHLAFDEGTGATVVEPGYFWQHIVEVEAHAA